MLRDPWLSECVKKDAETPDNTVFRLLLSGSFGIISTSLKVEDVKTLQWLLKGSVVHSGEQRRCLKLLVDAAGPALTDTQAVGSLRGIQVVQHALGLWRPRVSRSAAEELLNPITGSQGPIA